MYIIKLNGEIINRLLYIDEYNKSIINYMRYYNYYKKEVYNIDGEIYELYIHDMFPDNIEIIYEED